MPSSSSTSPWTLRPLPCACCAPRCAGGGGGGGGGALGGLGAAPATEPARPSTHPPTHPPSHSLTQSINQQALVQEEAIRHWATTVAYRMDLAAARRWALAPSPFFPRFSWRTAAARFAASLPTTNAPTQLEALAPPLPLPGRPPPRRSGDPARVEHERQRFLRAFSPVAAHPGPKLIVTDSQAGASGGGGAGTEVEGRLHLCLVTLPHTHIHNDRRQWTCCTPGPLTP